MTRELSDLIRMHARGARRMPEWITGANVDVTAVYIWSLTVEPPENPELTGQFGIRVVKTVPGTSVTKPGRPGPG
jgi:hypothetical protein